MPDDSKQVYRKTLDERRADPRRVFSWRFRLDDEKQQKARAILEQWELDYHEQSGEEVTLPEIMTDIILDMEYQRPSPRMDERRLSNMVLKRLTSLESIMKEISERDPIMFQSAIEAHKQNEGTIEDDFISDMFDDFDNTGDR